MHGFEAGVNVIFTRGIGLVLNHMLTYFKKGNLTLVSLKDIFCLKYKLNLYRPPTKKLITLYAMRKMCPLDMLNDFILFKWTSEGQKENLDIVLREANQLILCKQLTHFTSPYCFLRSPPETAHAPLGPVGIIPL